MGRSSNEGHCRFITAIINILQHDEGPSFPHYSKPTANAYSASFCYHNFSYFQDLVVGFHVNLHNAANASQIEKTWLQAAIL